MDKLLNEISHDGYLFSVQDYVPSAWIGHAPFLKFLIREQKPKKFVELGVHNGFSFFVGCQAIKECNIEASAYAIDHWIGDEQAGFFDSSVFHNVEVLNEKYSTFSTLLRMSFDDALDKFGDSSIDLLHIDGFHTYESVRRDFESWLSKMDKNGIILMHDIHVRRDSFGVYSFWKEIKSQYNTIEFVGSHGLGVVFLGEVPRGKLERLFDIAVEGNLSQIQGTFGSISDDVIQNSRFSEINRAVAERDSAVAERDSAVAERDSAVAERDSAVAERDSAVAERYAILDSNIWKIFSPYRKLMRVTRKDQWRVNMKAAHVRLKLINLLDLYFPRFVMQKISPNIRNIVKHIVYPEPIPLAEKRFEHFDRTQPHLTSPSFPTIWRPQIADWLARDKTPVVCLIIHVYYIELFNSLIEKIAKIAFEFDLVITNSSSVVLDKVEISQLLNKSKVKDILILKTSNRGRDILPLIHCVNAGILDGYEYLFKFHTKKSQWAVGRQDIANGGGGTGWYQSFIEDLIGDGTNSLLVLENLKRNIDLGIVTARGSLFGSGYWGENLQRTRELATRLELEFSPEELLFPAGSMYACKGLVIQGLRALCLSQEDFEPELGQIDGTTAHAVERLMGLVSIAGGYNQLTTGELNFSKSHFPKDTIGKSRFVAYYLPQFHSEPINDIHWGENFTEWNNVTRALPQYSDHFQPLLPTELGFYNLESPGTVIAQENLAKNFGISAFMYYYYNFGDTVALQKPIINRLERSDGLPFSILWVNENWTRNWDGLKSEVIVEQRYPDGWEFRFIESAASFLRHPDYLRDSQNRPIFSIYRPSAIPNVKNSIRLMREHARTIGIGELHILFADTQSSFADQNETKLAKLSEGFHSFPPHGVVWNPYSPKYSTRSPSFEGKIYSYDHGNYNKKEEDLKTTYHYGVLTRFDNTARRLNKAHIIYGSNPYTFRRALLNSKRLSASNMGGEKLIFLNAWNEWAEGAILEPSNRFGKTYLLAIRELSD